MNLHNVGRTANTSYVLTYLHCALLSPAFPIAPTSHCPAPYFLLLHPPMQVLEATKMPNLYERLKGSVELLDKIMKGLNAYLEKKRLYFPRYVCTYMS